MSTLSNNTHSKSIYNDNLTDKKIQKYTKKHTESKRIADLYTVLAYDENKLKSERQLFLKKADSIRNCNSSIYFCIDPITQEQHLFSRFCKQRFCPICNYNDELKHFKIFSQIVNHQKVNSCKWLFITLTIKNSESDTTDLNLTINNLKTAINTILKGFRSLTTSERSLLKSHTLGMFRSLEITRNKKNGSFHPHLHLLICVDKTYNPKSKDFITKDKLQKHWQKVCKLDYLPIVDIEFVDTSESEHAVAEVSKYQTKSADIINADTLYILSSVLDHTRVRGYTGIIKELKQEIEEKLESEKIKLNDIILDERFIKQLLKWDSFKSCFRFDKKGSEKLNNALQEKIKQEHYLNELTEQCLNNLEVIE